MNGEERRVSKEKGEQEGRGGDPYIVGQEGGRAGTWMCC